MSAALPKVTVEAALISNPLDASPSWIDVSTKTKPEMGLRSGHIKRGRSHELDRMQAGTCDLTFRNDDDRWNPWNTWSPFYGNLLSANQASLETNTTGWAANASTSISRVTSQALSGSASLQLQRTGTNGTAGAVTTTGTGGIRVDPGTEMTAMAWFKADSTGRDSTVTILWYDQFGVQLSGDNGTPVTSVTTDWTFGFVTATAPANTSYAAVQVTVASCIATEVHYVDQIALNGGGYSLLGWTPGGLGGLVQPMLKVRVKAQWNLLTVTQASFEDGTTGWSENAAGNVTVSQNAAHFLDGAHSMQLQRINSDGDIAAWTPQGQSGIVVTPGETYSAMASFEADSTGRTCHVSILWYGAGGALISTDTSAGVTDTTGAWRPATLTATAPASANYATIQVDVQSCINTEIHYVDCVALFPAGNITVWSRGGPYYLFTGYVESIEHSWPNSRYAETTVTAVDGFKVLSLAKAARTTYYDAVIADGADGYYRLNDTGTANVVNGIITAADSSGNAYDATYGGSPASYNNPSPLPTEVGSGAVDFGSARTAVGAGWVEIPAAPAPHGTTDFTVEAWVFPRSITQSGTPDKIWQMYTAGGQNLQLGIANNGTVRLVAVDASNNGGSIAASTELPVGRWTHVVAVKSGSTGGSNWKMYFDGVDVSTGASTSGTGDCDFTALVSEIGGRDSGAGVIVSAFDGLITEFALYSSALSSGTVAAHYAAGYGLANTALTGDRIDSILDVAGLPSGDRDIDAGQFLMQAVTQPTWESSPLPLILDYVDSEGYPAAFFFDGEGIAVFQDNAHATPSVTATFGDDQASELNPRAGSGGSPPVRDDLDLWTTVVRQADGGVAQHATDSTAVTRYVDRTLSRTGLKNADDADCATVAAADLARYKAPADRIKGLRIRPIGDPANLYPAVLGMEINDRIAYNRHTTPGGGAPMALDLRTEGVETSFGPGQWETTLMAVPT